MTYGELKDHLDKLAPAQLEQRVVWGGDDARDAARYRRLQVLGAAPGGSKHLDNGTVLRFSGLDAAVDADLRAHPSRGEFRPTTPIDEAPEAL